MSDAEPHMPRITTSVPSPVLALAALVIVAGAWRAAAPDDGARASVVGAPLVLAAKVSEARSDLAAVELSPVRSDAGSPEAPTSVEPTAEPLHERVDRPTGTVCVVLNDAGSSSAPLRSGKVTLSQPRDSDGHDVDALLDPLEVRLEAGVATLGGVPVGLTYTLTLYIEGIDTPVSVRRPGPSANGDSTEVVLDYEAELRGVHERGAIATLRSLAAAQQQLQASSAIDTDADGGGEYGYLAELAGRAPLRCWDPALLMARIGDRPLVPPYLAARFGELESAGRGGAVRRNGYLFQVHLPGADFGGLTEVDSGGAPYSLPDASHCERLWCCYAWPVDAETTPYRVFFINQEGDVVSYRNDGNQYSGPPGAPEFDAAYSSARPHDMSVGLGLAQLGASSNDANTWIIVGD